MKYIFLPGNSIKNKDWINQLSKEFKGEKEIIHYEHWKEENKNLDLDTELEKIGKLEGGYTVVAKSAGTILALLANKKELLNIKEFFLIGIPYGFAKEILKVDLDNLLKNTKQPITIIQKEKDIAGHYEFIKEYVQNINQDIKVIKYEVEGEPIDTHSYENTKYLNKIIVSRQQS